VTHRSRIIAWLLTISSVNCGRSRPPAPPSDRFDAIVVDTKPGLSGLAVNDQGTLFSIAERDRFAYAITLGKTRDSRAPALVTELPIVGLAEDPTLNGLDTEGIAWLGGNLFAFALEGQDTPAAAVAWAELRGSAMQITRMVKLSNDDLGIELTKNHGAEGICGSGDTVFVALENWRNQTESDGSVTRWTPIARLRDGSIGITWVKLQSKKGKLSSLDCTTNSDGVTHFWAIERHYETSLVEEFSLPAMMPHDIEPKITLDLSAAIAGRRNLEGIAQMPDGQIVIAVDNQGNHANGPSELLLVK
jgi:hypothetical protein